MSEAPSIDYVTDVRGPMLEALLESANLDTEDLFRDKTVVALGPGKDATEAVIAKRLGARKVVGIDQRPTTSASVDEFIQGDFTQELGNVPLTRDSIVTAFGIESGSETVLVPQILEQLNSRPDKPGAVVLTFDSTRAERMEQNLKKSGLLESINNYRLATNELTDEVVFYGQYSTQ